MTFLKLFRYFLTFLVLHRIVSQLGSIAVFCRRRGTTIIRVMRNRTCRNEDETILWS